MTATRSSLLTEPSTTFWVRVARNLGLRNGDHKNKDDITFADANRRVFIPLRLTLLVAAMAIVLTRIPDTSAVGLLLLFCCACMLVGTLFGFIFGIPRSVSGGADVSGGYRANTNLEDVSDWLTKILIGIGLVEAKDIGDGLSRIVQHIVEKCSGQLFSCPTLLIWSLMIGFLLLGFFGGYLRTRMYLPLLFLVSDAKGKAVTKADLEEQDQFDRDANDAVESQLAKGGAMDSVPRAEVMEKVSNASEELKPKFFFRARELRVIGERDGQDSENMIRGVPVFEALIASDENKNRPPRFHTNYGQIGYIYLRAKPGARDPAKAIEYLTKAIEVRGQQGEQGWRQYELCRALARIIAGSMVKDDVTNQLIYDDLHVARQSGLFATDRRSANVDRDEKLVQDWATANKAWLDTKPKLELRNASGVDLTSGTPSGETE